MWVMEGEKKMLGGDGALGGGVTLKWGVSWQLWNIYIFLVLWKYLEVEARHLETLVPHDNLNIAGYDFKSI